MSESDLTVWPIDWSSQQRNPHNKLCWLVMSWWWNGRIPQKCQEFVSHIKFKSVKNLKKRSWSLQMFLSINGKFSKLYKPVMCKMLA